jgi:hypothetical protein
MISGGSQHAICSTLLGLDSTGFVDCCQLSGAQPEHARGHVGGSAT